MAFGQIQAFYLLCFLRKNYFMGIGFYTQPIGAE